MRKIKGKIALTVCLAVVVMSIKAQQEIIVIGTFKSVPATKNLNVFLFYPGHGGLFKHDSTMVVDGHFSFKTELPAPNRGYLFVGQAGESFNNVLKRSANQMGQLGFFMEAGNISATLDYEKPGVAVFRGTPSNDTYEASKVMMAAFAQKEQDIYKRQAATPKNGEILKEYKQMIIDRTHAIGEFAKNHPDSKTSLDLLEGNVNPTENAVDARKYFSYLSADLKDSGIGRRYLAIIDQASKLDVHLIAPNFSVPDSTGKVYQMSDFKGKYVLIDFWASWCGPCRAENPNLINVYQQAKRKNFEIVGVSLDGGNKDSRAKWLEAIKKDKITWPQLSDLSGFHSDMAQAYMISAIPMNFLLSPTGEIIAKNLRGEELVNELKKLHLI